MEAGIKQQQPRVLSQHTRCLSAAPVITYVFLLPPLPNPTLQLGSHPTHYPVPTMAEEKRLNVHQCACFYPRLQTVLATHSCCCTRLYVWRTLASKYKHSVHVVLPHWLNVSVCCLYCLIGLHTGAVCYYPLQQHMLLSSRWLSLQPSCHSALHCADCLLNLNSM